MVKKLKLDRLDINILCELQRNGRISNVELAARVGLSASPCLQRVKRLEDSGYIERYEAIIALSKINDYVTIFTEMTLRSHRREDFIKFESEIGNIPCVQECYLVSGGYDYLVKFVSSSIVHYQKTIETILENDIGLDKYFSYIVIKSINKPGVPVSELVGASNIME